MDDPDLSVKRQAARERLLSEMPPSTEEYRLDMFASLPQEEFLKVRGAIEPIEEKISNAHLSYVVNSKKKGAARVKKLQEERDKKFAQFMREKQEKLRKYAIEYGIDPREGVIAKQLNEDEELANSLNSC